MGGRGLREEGVRGGEGRIGRGRGEEEGGGESEGGEEAKEEKEEERKC